MSDVTYGSGDGTVFIQPDGPNTKPEFAGCVDVAELDEPLGDAALWMCRDPKVAGGFKTARVVRGGPGLVTTQLMTDLRGLAHQFEELEDNTPVYVCMFDNTAEGRLDVFGNASRTFVTKFLATNRNRGNLVTMRTEGEPDRSVITVDIAGAPPLYAMYDLKDYALRVSISETNALNGIAFCDLKGKEGFAVCDAGAAVTANVLRYDVDAGVSWAAAAADPFAADEHIIGQACFEIDKDTTRWLVARGVTDAAAAAEVAYSDDNGATWTTVDVGSTNGEFVSSPGALFALDKNNIWLGTDGGYIFYSEDGGLTWSAQESAVIHAADWNAIYFYDALRGMAVGDSDVIAYTSDGGSSWSQKTATGGGNDITCLGFSDDFWWVGDSGGDLYYSDDNGTTWTQRAFEGDGAGSVNAVKFGNEFFGVMAHDTAGGLGQLFVTQNGGYDWTEVTLPTNGGINDLWIVGPRKVYAVGEVQGSTGFLVKVESPISNYVPS